MEAKEAKHKELAAMEAQYKAGLTKNAVEVAEKAKEFEKQRARLAAQKEANRRASMAARQAVEVHTSRACDLAVPHRPL